MPAPAARRSSPFALDDLARMLAPAPSPGQEAALRLIDGQPPREQDEAALMGRLLGRPWDDATRRRYPKVVLKAGRGSGKTLLASRFALHRALTGRVRDLAPGQWAYVPVVAPRRDKAVECMSYVRGALLTTGLRRACLREPTDHVDLARGVRVYIASADRGGTAVRGATLLGVVLDEANLFREKTSAVVNDRDVLEAALPRLRGQALLISSPWVEAGEFHKLHDTHFGQSRADVLALDCDDPRLLNPAWEPPPGMRPGTPQWAREVEGRWVSDDEEVLFPRESIAARMRRPNEPAPQARWPADAIDLSGGGRARTAHALGGWTADGRMVVASVESWPATVPVAERFRRIAARRAPGMGACAADQFSFDAAQAIAEGAGFALRRDAGNRAVQATRAAELIRDGAVSLPHDARLLRDLPTFRLRRQSGGGVTLQHPQQDAEGGHGDESVAVLLLLAELERAGPGVMTGAPRDDMDTREPTFGRISGGEGETYWP